MNQEAKFLNDYEPYFWFKNSHLMTLAGAILPRNLKACATEAVLIPVDKESMILAQLHLREDIKRCLVIIHGLEGSSNSSYVTGLTSQALALGFNVVRLNLRNCGNTLHLTPTLYNAGQSGDLHKVIDWLKEKKGQSEQYIVGYSLGGNLVLKALAEMGKHQSVKAACVISPSIDLAASVDCLDKGFNKLYAQSFLYSLRKKILAKHKLFPRHYHLSILEKVGNMRSFDNLFTAPNAGYDDAAHYYREASAKHLIEKIQTNTLIITAQDDPIVPFISFANIDNAFVQLLAPKHGGHVSFLNNSGFGEKKDPFWADKQILSYCLQQSHIKENNFV